MSNKLPVDTLVRLTNNIGADFRKGDVGRVVTSGERLSLAFDDGRYLILSADDVVVRAASKAS